MSAIKIDGRKIAESLQAKLTEDVAALKKQKVVPTMAVILLGDHPASLSYIKQKQLAAEKIGARVDLIQLPVATTNKELKAAIKASSDNPANHGVIVQRPVPNPEETPLETLLTIAPLKDVDGFVPGSAFEPPIARAVVTILEKVYYEHFNTPESNLVSWLRAKSVIVAGKGETAGYPIAQSLEKLGIPIVVVDRQTLDPETILRKGDIIISCIGKERYLTPTKIKTGAIVISVGITKGENGKLHGDYDEEEIADKAFAYTPTPGGVGPINVACLMHNLVKAAQMR